MKTQGRLIVDVARLDSAGEWYRGETAPELLELGESDYTKAEGGMRYDLKVELIGQELLVRGSVRQRLTCVCSRCADTFAMEAVDDEFVQSYEVDAETAFVDLTEAVRESILLALFSYPVCSTACKGICMKCGVNLNHAQCQCHNKGGDDDRWAALGQLEI